MNIEDKINELGSLLKQAVINGDYEFVKAEQCTAHIIIAGYTFQMWIANELPENFKFYSVFGIDNSLWGKCHIPTMQFTPKQREKAYNKIKPLIDKYHKQISKANIKAKISALEERLKHLEDE